MPTADTVHIIDDGKSFAQSLALPLANAKLKIRLHQSPAVFFSQSQSLPAGCLLTGLSLPGMTAIDLLRDMRKRDIAIPVIILTGSGTIPLAVEAMRLGASDFLELPVQDDVLLRSIQFAFERNHDDHGASHEHSETMARLNSLSLRERQVLAALIAGRPNKIIAYELGISIRTIEIHRANVMAKMNAKSLPELVRMAVIAGMSAPRKRAAG